MLDGIQMAQDKFQWQPLVNMVMNLVFRERQWHFSLAEQLVMSFLA